MSLPLNYASEFRSQFLLQPLDDLVARGGHLRVRQCAVMRLVGQVIRQALPAGSDLLAAEHIKELHLRQQFAACLGYQRCHFLRRDAFVQDECQILQHRREGGHVRGLGYRRDQFEQQIQVNSAASTAALKLECQS